MLTAVIEKYDFDAETYWFTPDLNVIEADEQG